MDLVLQGYVFSVIMNEFEVKILVKTLADDCS